MHAISISVFSNVCQKDQCVDVNQPDFANEVLTVYHLTTVVMVSQQPYLPFNWLFIVLPNFIFVLHYFLCLLYLFSVTNIIDYKY